ncbi:MAG TPA: hypothetical protein VMY77_01335 [Chitinophagaceae bacterium]|nr:hypothetical protein [Chitinophagaceae bacterium]
MKRILPILIICLLLGSCKKNEFETLRTDGGEIPQCIQDKIAEFLKLPKDGRPYSITEYLYGGNLVYYVISPCCDQYNPVYNSSCEYLGSPNGGFSGGGDGKLADFFSLATNKKILWENK